MMKSTTPREETQLIGLPVSEGVVLARIRLMEKPDVDAVPFFLIAEEAVSSEIALLEDTLTRTALQLESLIEKIADRIGPAQANIFLAQKLMVEDATLHEEMFATIREQRFNAEAAIEKTFESYRRLLADLEDDYLKERAVDIDEIRRRLLDTMVRGKSGTVHAPPKPPPEIPDELNIVAAEELMPGQTVSLDTEHTVGFITERGGTASHAAILARALGIPAVSGIHHLMGRFEGGEEVLNANYPPRIGILGSAEAVLARLAPAIKRHPRPPGGWTAGEIDAYRKRLRVVPERAVPEPTFHGVAPPDAASLMATLRRVLPRNGIVVTDSGLHQTLVRRHFDVHAPRGLIVPNDFQSMGFGIPAAIGAKIAAPGRPVVAVIGDGCCAMTGMELLTAVREKVP
ncbi:MAG: hypothetical protein IH628_16630 [Proteobacteria bacterium]|nr:hypothetical protein [Pseudomonadota bacterium]